MTVEWHPTTRRAISASPSRPGHRPSQRKLGDLTRLGWSDREDDALAGRLQAQEDEDWAKRHRIEPDAVTDPTGRAREIFPATS